MGGYVGLHAGKLINLTVVAFFQSSSATSSDQWDGLRAGGCPWAVTALEVNRSTFLALCSSPQLSTTGGELSEGGENGGVGGWGKGTCIRL